MMHKKASGQTIQNGGHSLLNSSQNQQQNNQNYTLKQKLQQNTHMQHQITISNKTNVSSGHLQMNIPISPKNSGKPLNKQKLRIVSPVPRPQEDFEGQEVYMKSQDGMTQGVGKQVKSLASLYQRFNESPETLTDFTSIYNNHQCNLNLNNKNDFNQNNYNSNGQNSNQLKSKHTPANNAEKNKQLQNQINTQQFQNYQSASQLAMYQNTGNQIQNTMLLMGEYNSTTSGQDRNGSENRQGNLKIKTQEDQKNIVFLNSKYNETVYIENGSMSADEDAILSNLNQLHNGQTVFHEKAKSLTQNQFVKQQHQQQQNENSGNKKQVILTQQQQQLLQQQFYLQQQQQQLTPSKMRNLIQMSKMIKNSSNSQQKGEIIIDPATISPSSNQQKQPLKTRRKKSQGKINMNFQNLNMDEISKNQQSQPNNVRSFSQPQIRSQSQQPTSQERPVLQLKKNSIRNNNVESGSNLLQVQQQQFQQQFLLKQQETLRIAHLENSIERVSGNTNNANLTKQGSLKIVLKKNASIKQLGAQSQQQAIKITKDQILLKNQQNYNSQGSGNAHQNYSQAQLRSRSLSNSKFARKKTSSVQNAGGQQDHNQAIGSEDQTLFTQRVNSKDKNLIGNSFNQSISLANKSRCKSSSKVSNPGIGTSQEDQQINTQSIPIQNSSKVLMFKTNNEESNAKVAALKSIIKLSSNTNTNYIQTKANAPQRNQSKENIQNLSLNQIQTGMQIKQLAQRLKLQDPAGSSASQGQFVQKCASANQNKLTQQQQQYMQRITTNRAVNQQQNLNYHAQLKSAGIAKEQNTNSQEFNKQMKQKDIQQNPLNQIKISISQNNGNMISLDNKDNSSSLKLGSGQVNIRNIKLNSSQQQQQKMNNMVDQENITSLASISTNKAQINHQQKMHQILMNQQTKQQFSQTQMVQQNISKQAISRNAFNAATTLEGSGSLLNQKRQSAGVDMIPKTFINQNIGGVHSNESFQANESNQKSIKEQFSRKNSTLSNGTCCSVQTQVQTNQKELLQSTNVRSDAYTIKNQSKDIISRLQNTSQITCNTQGHSEITQRKDNNQKQTDHQTIFTENILQNQNSNKPTKQFSDDKCSGGKRLNFYNQMSPTSEILSQFKDSQMISAFKSHDETDFNDSQCCIEDESIVIIKEDQLRLPLRSSKQSQGNQDNSQKFVFDDNLLKKQETIEIPSSVMLPNSALSYDNNLISKEDMVLQSIDSDMSVFQKKHDNSVIEQESLVTQIKTQLMKIQFQQVFQGDTQKIKRHRNQYTKDCYTMKEGGVSNRIKVELENSQKQSIQGSGTFYFEPQFDDISFEIDTCNQIRVPKNMCNPINQANIMSVPDDLQVYQENIDPQTGKVKFTLDAQTVTILVPNIKKANILRAENQILKQSVINFPDPLSGRLKQDYDTNQEEKQEDEVIQKQLETTFNQAPSIQPVVTEDQSLSFRHSLCSSSNNYSLNTFLSEDVSLNSNLFSHLINSNSNNQVTTGIMMYAAEKMNVREGDPLFLLPRLNDQLSLQLRLALLKREPEWWLGHEMPHFGGPKNNDNEPRLESFIF